MSAALAFSVEPTETAGRVGRAAFVLSLRERGVSNLAVLRAMETVPRELFAPRRYADLARADVALPLPCGQTMTGPAAVAAMLVALDMEPGQRVLEIGTGSGYVAALLAAMGARVHSCECRPILAESAASRLRHAGALPQIDLEMRDGLVAEPADGTRFARILVNGALPALPVGLAGRLGASGRLVCALSDPLPGRSPRLAVLTRAGDGQLGHVLGGPIRLSPLLAAHRG